MNPADIIQAAYWIGVVLSAPLFYRQMDPVQRSTLIGSKLGPVPMGLVTIGFAALIWPLVIALWLISKPFAGWFNRRAERLATSMTSTATAALERRAAPSRRPGAASNRPKSRKRRKR